MGLLEDAIREHLDLKRRHGAPEQELERQEVEALGPNRLESPPGPADGSVGAAEPPPVDDADGTDVEGVEATAAEAGDAGAAGVEDFETPAVKDEVHEAEHEPHAPAEAAEAGDQSALEADPEPAVVDQPTELFDVDEALAGDTPRRGFPAQRPDEEPAVHEEPALDEEPALREPPAEVEPFDDEEPAEGEEADVLEDTPDFLQDAPEHDRLWFEQKPPRDFDFD